MSARVLPWLAGVVGLLVAGCFSPRSFLALSPESWPQHPVALLPVKPYDVVFAFEADQIVADREGLARTCNEVLNTLADGSKNPLLGPEKLRRCGLTAAEWDRVHVCLDDPGKLDEPWKLKELAALANKVGAQELIWFRPTVAISNMDSSMTHFKGTVSIRAERFRLGVPQHGPSGVGEAQHWSNTGLFAAGGAQGAIVIPYAVGKTLSHTVDEALRQALTELFQKNSPGSAAP